MPMWLCCVNNQGLKLKVVAAASLVDCIGLATNVFLASICCRISALTRALPYARCSLHRATAARVVMLSNGICNQTMPSGAG